MPDRALNRIPLGRPSRQITPPSRKELEEYTAARRRFASARTGPLDESDEDELVKRFLGEQRLTLVDPSAVVQMEGGSRTGRPNLRFLSNNRHPDLGYRRVELFGANEGSELDNAKSIALWHIASEFYNTRLEAENEWVSVSPAVLDHVLEQCGKKVFTEGEYTGLFDTEILEGSSQPTDSVYTRVSDMEKSQHSSSPSLLISFALARFSEVSSDEVGGAS